jgi:hypothetical protein
MKTIIALTALSALSLSLWSATSQAAMDPHVENTLIAVCKAGASNKVFHFNDTMKSYRINKARIFPRLVCNGESFYQFTLSHNANKTARLIAPYAQGSVTIQDLAYLGKAQSLYDIRY